MKQGGKGEEQCRSPEEQETAGEIRGTSRQDEEAFLRQALSVIYDGLENYGRQVANMRAEIGDMPDHFHDDNSELINLLENSIFLHDWCHFILNLDPQRSINSAIHNTDNTLVFLKKECGDFNKKEFESLIFIGLKTLRDYRLIREDVFIG